MEGQLSSYMKGLGTRFGEVSSLIGQGSNKAALSKANKLLVYVNESIEDGGANGDLPSALGFYILLECIRDCLEGKKTQKSMKDYIDDAEFSLRPDMRSLWIPGMARGTAATL